MHLVHVTTAANRTGIGAPSPGMLAEKDPLALLLYAQYKSLAMPNLRLGDTDVTALLTFIEEQTRRLQTPATAKNGD